jgi:hypothetical protein
MTIPHDYTRRFDPRDCPLAAWRDYLRDAGLIETQTEVTQ